MRAADQPVEGLGVDLGRIRGGVAGSTGAGAGGCACGGVCVGSPPDTAGTAFSV